MWITQVSGYARSCKVGIMLRVIIHVYWCVSTGNYTLECSSLIDWMHALPVSDPHGLTAGFFVVTVLFAVVDPVATNCCEDTTSFLRLFSIAKWRRIVIDRYFLFLCSVFIVVFTVSKQVFWKSVDVPPPAIVTAKSTRLGSDLEHFSREKCPPSSIIENITYMAPMHRTVLHCLLWVHLKEGPHPCWSLIVSMHPGFEGAELRKKGFARGEIFYFTRHDMTWYQYKKHFPTGVVTGESTAAHCHGLTKAILFSSPVWGVAYSLVCAARCSKSWSIWLAGNHVDFRTIYALTTGINCTRYCSCNYSQTALMQVHVIIRIQCHISLCRSIMQQNYIDNYAIAFWDIASSPGPSQILSRSRGKIWEGPGDEAIWDIHISYSYSLILALHAGIVYPSSTSNPSKLLISQSHPVNSLAYSYVAWIYWP